MRKRLILLSALSLFSLSSCGSGFNIIKKYKVIDETKLYLGSYSTVSTEDGYNFENIMYLDFYNSAEEREATSQVYDKAINLSNAPLISLDSSMTDDNGNPLLFFDVSTILNQFVGTERTFKQYLDEGNHLDVFFSYGTLGSQINLVTGRVNITQSGIYYFSTVSEEGAKPTFSHSLAYKEEIQRINPFA